MVIPEDGLLEVALKWSIKILHLYLGSKNGKILQLFFPSFETYNDQSFDSEKSFLLGAPHVRIVVASE